LSEQEDNKAIVRRWIEAYNNRDIQQVEADVLAPGYVAHAPAASGPLDTEAWRQFTAAFIEAFPDLRLTVEDIFSVGDMVAARIAFHGTHRGEFQGIPPTGKEVAFSSIEIDRVVDGKVQEHWFELDLLGLMRQLGPSPSQSSPRKPAPPRVCGLFMQPRRRSVFSEVQRGDEERRSVRRVMSSSCSQPSPTKV
jgi:steroid delta-isomerase-like uncharacterized protein